jgi:hypothetical protein
VNSVSEKEALQASPAAKRLQNGVAPVQELRTRLHMVCIR